MRIDFCILCPVASKPLDLCGRAIYTGHMADASDETPKLTSEPLSRAIGERYLTYALSTIMHRALPDARDGLKPVHDFWRRDGQLPPPRGRRDL
jgi:hypothetical protein